MINLIKLPRTESHCNKTQQTVLCSVIMWRLWQYVTCCAYFATDPQGMYSMVDLVERGHALPLSVGSWFNVSHLDKQDAAVEKILQRCSLHLTRKIW